MDNSENESNVQVSVQWQDIAKQIKDLIRVSGIDVFREAVRQVSYDRLKIEDERERREEQRHEALKEKSVLYLDGAIPDRPKGDWFFHQDLLWGYIKLPSEVIPPPNQLKRPAPPACLRNHKPRKEWNNTDKQEIQSFYAKEAKYQKRIEMLWPKLHCFNEVKQRRFPNEDDGDFRYEFDLCCWLPRELAPATDPQNEELLPVPSRELSNVEKIAVLAAIYDAHWRGSEKVTPWGLSDDRSDPVAWQANGAKRDEKRAALVYFLLFQKAQLLDQSDLTVVESWLVDNKSSLSEDLLKEGSSEKCQHFDAQSLSRIEVNLPESRIRFDDVWYEVSSNTALLISECVKYHPKPVFASHLDGNVRADRIVDSLPSQIKKVFHSARNRGCWLEF